jgi:N12 class adenine-specific DNA methylase
MAQRDPRDPYTVDEAMADARQGVAGMNPKVQTLARSGIEEPARRALAEQQNRIEDVERQQRQAQDDVERQQREAETAQRAAEARDVRAGVAAGADTETDIETGRRTIARHDDGAVKFKPGPVGNPQQVLEDRSTTIPEGFLGSPGETIEKKEATWQQKFRDDRGREVSEPLPKKTDPKTGEIYVETPDAFGRPQRQVMGMDPKHAQRQMIEQDAAKISLRDNALAQTRMQFEPRWQPVKAEYLKAKEELEAIKPIERNPKDGSWSRVSESGKTQYFEQEAVARHFEQLNRAKKRFEQAERAFKPEDAKNSQLTQAERQVKLDRLKLEAKKIALDNDLPADDGGTASFLASAATGLPDPDREKAAEIADEPAPDPQQAALVTAKVSERPDADAVRKAFPTLQSIDEMQFEPTGNGMTRIRRGQDVIGRIDNTAGSPVVVLDIGMNADLRNQVAIGQTGGVPVYLRDGKRKPEAEEAAWAAEVHRIATAVAANPMQSGDGGAAGIPAMSNNEFGTAKFDRDRAIKELGADPASLIRKVKAGELSVQRGESIMKDLWGGTLKVDDPADPATFDKWLQSAPQETRMKWAKAKGTRDLKEQDSIQNEFVNEWYAQNRDMPGVTWEMQEAMRGKVAQRNSVDLLAENSKALGGLLTDAAGSMGGLMAKYPTLLTLGIMDLAGVEGAPQAQADMLEITGRANENFKRGLAANYRKWMTPEGRPKLLAVDQSIGALQAVIATRGITGDGDAYKNRLREAVAKVTDASYDLHAMGLEEGWEVTREDLDPNKDQALGSALLSYIETGDPSMMEAFKRRLLLDKGQRQAEMQMQDLTEGKSRLAAAFTAGGYATDAEALIELGTTLATAGTAKLVTTTGKMLKAGDAAADAGKSMVRVRRIADEFKSLGKVPDTLAKPAGKAGRAWNKGVDVAKVGVANAGGEFVQEGIAALGDPTATAQSVLEQASIGAIAGLFLAPVIGGPTAIANISAQNNQRKKQLSDFAGWYNRSNADTEGFTPLAPQDAEAALAMLDPERHSQLVAEHDAAMAEMRAAAEEAANAVTPPRPERAAPSDNGTAAEVNAAWQENAASRMSRAFSKVMETRGAVASYVGGVIEASQSAKTQDAPTRARTLGLMKVATGRPELLTGSERAAIGGLTTADGMPYFATVGGKDVFTAEGRAELLQDQPVIGALVQTDESRALIDAAAAPLPATTNEQNPQGQPTSEGPPPAPVPVPAVPTRTQGAPDAGQSGSRPAGDGAPKAKAEAQVARPTYRIEKRGGKSVVTADGLPEPVWEGKDDEAEAAMKKAQSAADSPLAVANRAKRRLEARYPALKGKIRLDDESPATGGGGVEASAAGISFNMADLEREMPLYDPEARDARVDAGLDEEVIHLAQFAAVEKLGVTPEAYYGALWDEFTPEQQQAGSDVYQGNWSKLEPWQKAAEIVRMLIQAKRSGRVTEVTKAFSKSVPQQMLELLAAALEYLKGLGSKISPRVQATIDAVEGILAEHAGTAGNRTKADAAAADSAVQGEAVIEGTDAKLTTPNNERTIDVKQTVVELGQLVGSGDPRFPSLAFQPRDRSGAASAAQLDEMARNLATNPEQYRRYLEGSTTDTGRPLVAPLMEGGKQAIDDQGRPLFYVLSGNGRRNAIAEADRRGAAGGFYDSIREATGATAEKPIPVSIYQPTDGADAIQIAELSNRDAGLSVSNTEQAIRDARDVEPILSLWSPDESGNASAASNRDFIRAFVKATGDTGILAGDGSLTEEGALRIDRALLATLLGPRNKPVLEMIFNRDLGLRNAISGIASEAGNLLRIAVEKPAYDLSSILADALRQAVEARSAIEAGTATTAADYFDQGDLFADNSDSPSKQLARALAETRSKKAVREILGTYRQAADQIDTTTADMFGGVATRDDLIARALDARPFDRIVQEIAAEFGAQSSIARKLSAGIAAVKKLPPADRRSLAAAIGYEVERLREGVPSAEEFQATFEPGQLEPRAAFLQRWLDSHTPDSINWEAMGKARAAVLSASPTRDIEVPDQVFRSLAKTVHAKTKTLRAYDAEFQGLVRAAAAENPEWFPLSGPVKKVERSVEKAQSEWLENREAGIEMTPEQVAASLKDIVRASIIVQDAADFPAAIEAIGRQFKIKRVKNRWDNPLPSGYADILINVETPMGEAEIQLHIPEMLIAKQGWFPGLPEAYKPLVPLRITGHKLYEEQRTIWGMPSEKERVAALDEMMFELYGAALRAHFARTSSRPPVTWLNRTFTSSSVAGTSLKLTGFSSPNDPSTLIARVALPTNNPGRSVSPSNANVAPGGTVKTASITPDTPPGAAGNQAVSITTENIADHAGAVDASVLSSEKDNLAGAFDLSQRHIVVPLADLVSRKNELADPKFLAGKKKDPRQTAADWMIKAIRGEDGAKKRAPLDVIENADGTFTIDDGNATAQAMMLAGWTQVPISIKPAATLSSSGTLDGVHKAGSKVKAKNIIEGMMSRDFAYTIGNSFEVPAGHKVIASEFSEFREGKYKVGRYRIVLLENPDGERFTEVERGRGTGGTPSGETLEFFRVPTDEIDSNPTLAARSRKLWDANPAGQFSLFSSGTLDLFGPDLFGPVAETKRKAVAAAKKNPAARAGVAKQIAAIEKVADLDLFSESVVKSLANPPAKRQRRRNDSDSGQLGFAFGSDLPAGQQAVGPDRAPRVGTPDGVPAGNRGSRGGDIPADDIGSAPGDIAGGSRNDGTPDDADGRGGRPAAGDRAGRNGDRQPRREDAGRRSLSERERPPLDSPDRNFRIGKDTVLAEGGAVTRIRNNIAAIDLLRTLENEDRNPTTAEKQALAKFVGWGGLPQVFDEKKVRDIERGEIEQRRQTAKKYSSWGAQYADLVADMQKQASDMEAWRDKWMDHYKRLRELLTDDEWQSARDSTINAHYTSPTVIGGMWDAVKRFGFEGGNILEPAGGIGHYYGLMPSSIANKSRLFGVELDSISGRIFQKLYPEAEIEVTGFQNSNLPENSQDLVISNVPFANITISDATLAAQPDAPAFSLHNYFFEKALRMARPGGIVAFITTAHTMDSNIAQRKWLAERAEFVGAIRLPNDAFKGNANTDVVTDIIYLRKPDGGPAPVSNEWTGLREVEVSGGGKIQINEWFADHPEMILGRLADDGSMFAGRKEMTVHSDGADIAEALRNANNRLPSNIMGSPGERAEVRRVASTNSGAKLGAFTEIDGVIQIAGSTDTVAKADEKRVRAFMDLRDSLNDLYKLESDPDADDTRVEAARRRLNERYQSFKTLYKPLHDRKNRALLASDPDFYRTLGLEIPVKDGAKTTTYEKADVFTRRVLTPRQEPKSADTVEDAMLNSFRWRGRLDPAYVGELLNITVEEAEARLLATPAAFLDPATGLVEHRTNYLSGNVRRKLRDARLAAQTDPAFARNVEELEAAMPEDVPWGDIDVKMGSTWVPAAIYRRFLDQKVFGRNIADVMYNEGLGEIVSDSFAVRTTGNATDGSQVQWGTERKSPAEIAEAVLNMRDPLVKDTIDEGNGKTSSRLNAKETDKARQAADRMKTAFLEWLSGDPEIQDTLHRIYNESYNSHVIAKHDGSFMQLPWVSEKFDLYPSKKHVVWRALQDGSMIVAHGVGGGKTIIGTAIALESKRLGFAKKPLIVVHNATLEQFATTISQMAPTARVLIARKEDLAGPKRKEFMGRIASGDWDTVVMAHSTFDLIPDDPRWEQKQLGDLMDELGDALEAQGANRFETDTKKIKDPSVKELVKMRNRLKERMSKLQERTTDDTLTFQEMGFDTMVIDEAHRYKKVPFVTKQSNIAGIDTGFSKRGSAVQLRTKWVQAKNKGRGVFLMTGTPVTNTLGESWNMVRMVRPDLTKEFKVQSFDRFVSTFAEVTQSGELRPNGSYKAVSRLSKLANIPEWNRFWGMSADVKMGDDMDVKGRPKIKGGKPELRAVPRTPQVETFIGEVTKIIDRFDAMSGKEKRENSHIPLLTYNASRMAAIDIRLINPDAKDEPGSKVNVAIDEVLRLHGETTEQKGTQVIFADSYRPMRTTKLDLSAAEFEMEKEKGDDTDTGEGFNLYHDIREKLVSRGIPREEIAIIGEAKNDKQKEALFAAVNEGKIRVIMGSTETLGTGVNMQRRMIAAHHLDVPWTPAGLEQRDGRVYRQGNMWAELGRDIEILRYGMKDTLDAALWQKLETKERFIKQAVSGAISARSIEDDTGLINLAEQKAILSGPEGLAKFNLDEKSRQLGNEWRAHRNRKFDIERRRGQAVSQLNRDRDALEPARREAEAAAPLAADEQVWTVDGSEPATGEDARKLIDAAFKARRKIAGEKLRPAESEAVMAPLRVTVNGVPLVLKPASITEDVANANKPDLRWKIAWKPESSDIPRLANTPEQVHPGSLMTAIPAGARNIVARPEGMVAGIAQTEKDLEVYAREMELEFPKMGEFRQVLTDQANLYRRMGLSAPFDDGVYRSAGIDLAALRSQQEAAVESAAAETDPDPTDAQKEAGNYRKGKVTLHGMPISIENPRGSERSGTDKGGKPWSVTMPHHYGYFLRTEGKDGDHLDTFIGPDVTSTKVFVVNQIKPDGKGFDEHKVMLGFNSRQDAVAGYLASYSPGWKGLGDMVETDLESFKSWMANGDTTKRVTPASFPRTEGRGAGLEKPAATLSSSATQDAAYLAAVEAGDMKSAQRMVDQAAKAAGYTSPKVYHGTDGEFDTFKREFISSEDGFFFTSKKENAEEYGSRSISAYLKADSIYETTNAEWANNGGFAPDEAWDAGYDGYLIRDMDGADTWMVPNPNQIKSADPVTRDQAGNVIPLSQRFNPAKDSILYSAPTLSDTTAEALATMTPLYRNVFAAVLKGEPVADIATRYSIPDRAVRNITDQVRSRIRTLAAASSDEGLKPAMKDGKFSGGNPALALSTNPTIAAVDQIRQQENVPDVRGHAEVNAEAEAMLSRDYTGTFDALLAKSRDLQPYTDTEVAAAKIIISRETLTGKIQTPEERRKVAKLIHGYRDIGTETGRSLAIRRDPHKTPAERHAQYIAEALFTPDPDTRARMRKNRNEQDAILDRWLTRANGIKEALKADGFDIDATLAAFQERTEARKQAEAEAPRATAAVEEEIKRLDPTSRAIVEAIRSGSNWTAAAMSAGIDIADAKARYAKFREKVTDVMRGAARKYLAATLSASPTATESSILAELGLPDPDDIAESSTVPSVNRQKRKAAPRKPAKPSRPLAQPDMTLDEYAGRPLDTTRTVFQTGPVIPGMDGPSIDGRGEFDPANPDPIGKQLEPWKHGAPISGGLFDLNDPLAMKKVLDAFAIARGGKFDAMMEFWRMSILTGPQTHVVNISSSVMFGLYDLLPRRAVEAGINGMLGIVGQGSSESATFGEFSPMARQLYAAAARAGRNAIRSWRLESRVFEAQALALEQQLDFSGVKADYIPPALGGKLGTIMRSISFRAMTAVDEMMKSFLGQLEAAAQSHRIAKSEGLTGDAYASRIDELMKPGSVAWIRALDSAKRITFQSDLNADNPQLLGRLDQVAEALKKARRARYGGKLLMFFLPFIDTPTNIFKIAMEMSPMGAAIALFDAAHALKVKLVRGDLTKAEADAAAEEIYNRARLVRDLTNQTIAWGAFFALQGMTEADDDDETGLPMVTGSVSYTNTRRGERDVMFRTMPPQSIRIGNAIFSYRRFDPFASALSGAVDAIRAIRVSGGVNDEALSLYMGGIKDSLKDKTFLSGLSDLINAFENPDRFAPTLAGNIVTGFVPNLIRQPLREADPYIRDEGARPDEGFFEAIGKKLGGTIAPGSLPARIDVWGNPIRRHNGPASDSLLRILDPTDVNLGAEVDPIDRYILNWNLSAESKARLAIEPIGNSVSSRGKRITLTPAEQEEANRRAGQRARASLGTSWDWKSPTPQGIDRIRDAVRNAQDSERDRIRATKQPDPDQRN